LSINSIDWAVALSSSISNTRMPSSLPRRAALRQHAAARKTPLNKLGRND
jgi:hypothetical protein